MREFLASIVTALVDEPEQMRVEETNGSDGLTLLKIYTAENDAGKVIGKKGRTATALRTLCGAVGAKQGKRVLVEIEDKRSKE